MNELSIQFIIPYLYYVQSKNICKWLQIFKYSKNEADQQSVILGGKADWKIPLFFIKDEVVARNHYSLIS